MKADIKDLWVKALLSGDYEQGKYELCRNNKYCCLGVLSELATQAGVCQKETWLDRYAFDGILSVLPLSVKEWSGIGTACGAYASEHSLACDNDNGKSFAEIAEIIKNNF